MRHWLCRFCSCHSAQLLREFLLSYGLLQDMKLIVFNLILLIVPTALMILRYLKPQLTISALIKDLNRAQGISAFTSKESFVISSSAHHNMTNYTTVSYVTTPNEEIARQLSMKLVEGRLAACVNIIKGVESIYKWQGKVEQDTEVLMIIKSHSSKSNDLKEFVIKNHPYDCPEVVTVRVDSGSESYLKWVEDNVKNQPAPLSGEP